MNSYYPDIGCSVGICEQSTRAGILMLTPDLNLSSDAIALLFEQTVIRHLPCAPLRRMTYTPEKYGHPEQFSQEMIR